MELPAHAAPEIRKDEVRAAAADLEPHGEGAFGVEAHGNAGLAHAPALRLSAPDQAFALQLAQDHRHGLRRQARRARQVASRQRAVALERRQDQPLVVVAQALLVRAGAQARMMPDSIACPPLSLERRSSHS
jgi:hypothetical protein